MIQDEKVTVSIEEGHSMRGKKIYKGVLMFVALFAMVFISSTTAEAAAKLSKKSATLYVGETLQLKLTGGSGSATWKSNKSKIATVSKNGLVTAKKTGTCKISVKQAGNSYTCKITVKKLPKNYATVNGKRVKVGKTVTLKYKIKSSKPIATMSIKYIYNKKALKITNEEEMSRYPTWLCNEYYPDSIVNEKECDIAHLIHCDETKTDGIYYKNVDCKNGKLFEVMKVKVLKSGNYKMNVDVYSAMNDDGESVKGYKVTTTIK